MINKISENRIEMTEVDIAGTWGNVIAHAANHLSSLDHLHCIVDGECEGHFDVGCLRKEGLGNNQPSDYDKIVGDRWHE